MNDDALDLIEEQRLVDALGRRYEVWMFLGAKKKTTNTEPQIVTMRASYDGDRLRAIGLCHFLAARISADVEEDLEQDILGDE